MSNAETSMATHWKVSIDATQAVAMARRCIELPQGWKIQSVRIARVYPARPVGIGVQWELRLRHSDGRTLAGHVYVSSARDGRRPGRNRLRVAPQGPFAFGGLSVCPENSDALLHTPDCDDRLDLRHMTSPAALRRRMENSPELSWMANGGVLRRRCLSYRPRRRCTLAVSSSSDSAERFVVAKVLRSGNLERALTAHRRLEPQLRRRRDLRITTPAVVAIWPDAHTVVFEGLLQRPAPSSRSDTTAQAAGRILAAIHASEGSGLPAFTSEDELYATWRWVELARQLDRLPPAAMKLWIWLQTARARMAPRRACVIHRDYYDEQIVQTSNGWAVVDLDTLAVGDPEQDIGNYIGHTIWTATLAGKGAGSAQLWCECFTEGYADARRGADAVPDARRVRFYLVSSLLRLGIIHGLRTGAEDSAARLHERALSMLDAAPRSGGGRARGADDTIVLRRKP